MYELYQQLNTKAINVKSYVVGLDSFICIHSQRNYSIYDLDKLHLKFYLPFDSKLIQLECFGPHTYVLCENDFYINSRYNSYNYKLSASSFMILDDFILFLNPKEILVYSKEMEYIYTLEIDYKNVKQIFGMKGKILINCHTFLFIYNVGTKKIIYKINQTIQNMAQTSKSEVFGFLNDRIIKLYDIKKDKMIREISFDEEIQEFIFFDKYIIVNKNIIYDMVLNKIVFRSKGILNFINEDTFIEVYDAIKVYKNLELYKRRDLLVNPKSLKCCTSKFMTDGLIGNIYNNSSYLNTRSDLFDLDATGCCIYKNNTLFINDKEVLSRKLDYLKYSKGMVLFKSNNVVYVSNKNGRIVLKQKCEIGDIYYDRISILDCMKIIKYDLLGKSTGEIMLEGEIDAKIVDFYVRGDFSFIKTTHSLFIYNKCFLVKEIKCDSFDFTEDLFFLVYSIDKMVNIMNILHLSVIHSFENKEMVRKVGILSGMEFIAVLDSDLTLYSRELKINTIEKVNQKKIEEFKNFTIKSDLYKEMIVMKDTEKTKDLFIEGMTDDEADEYLKNIDFNEDYLTLNKFIKYGKVSKEILNERFKSYENYYKEYEETYIGLISTLYKRK